LSDGSVEDGPKHSSQKAKKRRIIDSDDD
jgi:hypothetical protein